jgi:hypothetical protein
VKTREEDGKSLNQLEDLALESHDEEERPRPSLGLGLCGLAVEGDYSLSAVEPGASIRVLAYMHAPSR